MTDRIKIVCVPPDMVGDLWPHVGPVLLKGQLHLTPSMLETLKVLAKGIKAVMANELQLWAVIDDEDKRVIAAMVTELLIDDDGSKVAWVMGMGGEDIARWGGPLSDRIAEFSKAEGCASVRFAGRKALMRAYRDCRIIGQAETGEHLFERALS